MADNVHSKKARDVAQQKIERATRGSERIRRRAPRLSQPRNIAAPPPRNRIPLWMATLLVATAIFVDVLDVLLGFFLGFLGMLLVVGPMLAWLISFGFNIVFGGLFLFIFLVRGVAYRPSQLLVYGGGFLIEATPILYMLPAWTFTVLGVIWLARRADKKHNKKMLAQRAEAVKQLRRPRGGLMPRPA